MVFVQLRSRHGNQPIEDIAASLRVSWSLNGDYEQLVCEVRSMIEAGSRYRNIDHHLGFGASLVLGTTLSETT